MIGEEINSLINIFEASIKRMTSIMVNYEDRKQDLKDEERKDRKDVIDYLRTSMKKFNYELEEQTRQFKAGAFQKD